MKLYIVNMISEDFQITNQMAYPTLDEAMAEMKAEYESTLNEICQDYIYANGIWSYSALIELDDDSKYTWRITTLEIKKIVQ